MAWGKVGTGEVVGTEATESQQSYRRTLRYAEAIAGGVDKLASRLKVSSASITAWSAGEGKIPDKIFLSAVDLICEATEDEVRRARDYRPNQTFPTGTKEIVLKS